MCLYLVYISKISYDPTIGFQIFTQSVLLFVFRLHAALYIWHYNILTTVPACKKYFTILLQYWYKTWHPIPWQNMQTQGFNTYCCAILWEPQSLNVKSRFWPDQEITSLIYSTYEASALLTLLNAIYLVTCGASMLSARHFYKLIVHLWHEFFFC